MEGARTQVGIGGGEGKCEAGRCEIGSSSKRRAANWEGVKARPGEESRIEATRGCAARRRAEMKKRKQSRAEQRKR